MTKERKANLKAREFFGILDRPNYVLHHWDPNLKYEWPERYKEWNPVDLVCMEVSEHIRWHNLYDKNFGTKGKKHSYETKEKIKNSMTGRKRGSYKRVLRHWKLVNEKRVYY